MIFRPVTPVTSLSTLVSFRFINSIDAAGFQGHGSDRALSQPGDDFAQARRVRGELTHGGVAAVAIDAHPVAGIADVDAGGLLVLHRQRRHPGCLCRLLPQRLLPTRHAANVLDSIDCARHSTPCIGHGCLHRIRCKVNGKVERPAGESAQGTSRPNGIDRDADAGRKRPSPNEWAENRSPAQLNQRAERIAQSTRNESGIDAGRSPIKVCQVPGTVGQRDSGREANNLLQQSAALLPVFQVFYPAGRRC